MPELLSFPVPIPWGYSWEATKATASPFLPQPVTTARCLSLWQERGASACDNLEVPQQEPPLRCAYSPPSSCHQQEVPPHGLPWGSVLSTLPEELHDWTLEPKTKQPVAWKDFPAWPMEHMWKKQGETKNTNTKKQNWVITKQKTHQFLRGKKNTKLWAPEDQDMTFQKSSPISKGNVYP